MTKRQAARRTIFRVQPTRTNRGRGWMILRDKKLVTVELLADGKTKRSAVSKAADFARVRPPSQLVVHNLDGRIEFERTYGSDPRRSKG